MVPSATHTPLLSCGSQRQRPPAMRMIWREVEDKMAIGRLEGSEMPGRERDVPFLPTPILSAHDGQVGGLKISFSLSSNLNDGRSGNLTTGQ